jgi:hypothetical protein
MEKVVMSHPLDDTAVSHANYRKEFASASLGTEEELNATILMNRNAASVVGVVKAESGEVLVEITKDIEKANYGTRGEFTIELRTTPTEMVATAGWVDRTKALQVAVWAIENNRGKALLTEEYRSYRTVISNPKHEIGSVPTGGISGAGSQATVGVEAAEIGATANPKDRANGRLHPQVTLPWYIDRFAEDSQVDTLAAREKIRCAMVMSAVLQLARIWAKYPTNPVNLLDAKNAWTVRPRTPPIEILDTFSAGSAVTAKAAIEAWALPDWADETGSIPSGKNWTDARQHILAGRPMGGHNPPAATINGRRAMLFEYRAPSPSQFDQAFWTKDMWRGSDFPEET